MVRMVAGRQVANDSPEKFCIFLHQNHTSVMHSDTLFEVILLLVENEQQCPKWFILQC